ncbi:hypothetical protein NIES4101_56610 [Calothrix sp. NIES-4101]|nr:hypothetical protein NIES4101_56610 [Calothrix sp. NIES-4101]
MSWRQEEHCLFSIPVSLSPYLFQPLPYKKSEILLSTNAGLPDDDIAPYA